ncbi:MAG TPA: beta-ketoacyl-[acyl-carrier-protein] synthase family protein [Candidatus Kapabacteria bacterium]|nr:beta-ketoacyl-[acyl-carrier-protein] synthase family protein [Candidatus Kapabacteria bacterium]
MSRRRVVVTGAGCVTPFGVGRDTFARALKGGQSAARMIEQFDTTGLPTRFAAPLPMEDRELEDLLDNPKTGKTLSRAGKMAVIAAQEAYRTSGLDGNHVDPYRIGITLGSGGLGSVDLDPTLKTFDLMKLVLVENGHADQANAFWQRSLKLIHPLSPLTTLPNIPTAHIAIQYNVRGSSQTITTACTSSAQAIGEAYRAIKHDYADAMITGGSDSMVNPNGLVAFSALGVLSKNNDEYRSASRPFDARRDGFMIGEGAAIFILEEWEHARSRGAKILAEVAGFGTASDAFRLTDEPPDAHGAIHAMTSALKDADMQGHLVDYVNAHGTGTKQNDRAETKAIKAVFDGGPPPVSSTKSMIGHLVAAAGAVEFMTSCIAMSDGFLPPTINYEAPDPECDLDYVPNDARTTKTQCIMSNSFGFGGQNASLILRRV